METRYISVKSLGKGIIAFDTVKNEWIITVNDLGYYPTCKWVREHQFRVPRYITDDTRQGALVKFAKKYL